MQVVSNSQNDDQRKFLSYIYVLLLKTSTLGQECFSIKYINTSLFLQILQLSIQILTSCSLRLAFSSSLRCRGLSELEYCSYSVLWYCCVFITLSLQIEVFKYSPVVLYALHSPHPFAVLG